MFSSYFHSNEKMKSTFAFTIHNLQYADFGMKQGVLVYADIILSSMVVKDIIHISIY